MTQPPLPPDDRQRPAPTRRRLGLPFVALVGLALLAVPRVVLHDLDLIAEGTPLNALFVFGPVIIWIGVAWAARVPNPFLTLLIVGALYGVFLALGHQLLWNVNTGGAQPQLGGNLSDIDPVLETVIFRVFATISSLFTGVIVGAISGLIAWGLSAITRRAR
ncbi:hypothetical protein [Microbacterium sp. MPKO10]|uniref:hypothetical protein n=1 Tax=Microbacterium sp. MPKO10 TaxID=2989818 RepID=UPI002236720A|nr:hypothetical protein [Microbacterium sp. MPKO10]MCW4457014.1 hypothetical protein [Microbacterium sp. MPKO10]